MTADVAMRSDLLHRLTPKERACLQLVANHLSSKEIAGRLGISKTSVDTYCDRAREKLGVRGRREAARILVAALADAPRAADMATASHEEPEATAAAGAAARRGRMILVVLATVMAPLAFATLLAGLRALREVVPDPYETPAVQAAGPRAHRG